MNHIQIAPSILAADFSRLGHEVELACATGADMLHVDVMDGHFVPNISFGPEIVRAIAANSSLPLDVHLMICPVDPYVDRFVEAGADIITFHPEATTHPHRTARMIKEAGIKAGLALNPGTPLSMLDWLIEELDLVLVMTVNPGFGGQKFISDQLKKIEAVTALVEQKGREGRLLIEVDGGITSSTAALVAAAGANTLVAGTFVFGSPENEYQARVAELRSAAEANYRKGLGATS